MKNHDPLDALIATAKRHDVPPEGAERDAWAGFVGALGGGGGGGEGAGPTAGAAAEAVARGAGTLGVGKAVAALAVAGVVAGAVGLGVSQSGPPQASPSLEAPSEVDAGSEPKTSAAPVATPPAGAVVPSSETAPEPQMPTSTPAAADPVRPPKPARASAPETPASQSTLAEEARLVGAMWKAIDRGDAEAALPLAAQHRARFPDGELAQEAQAAAVAARCILRRPINLTQLQALRRGASASVAKRLEGACAERE